MQARHVSWTEPMFSGSFEKLPATLTEGTSPAAGWKRILVYFLLVLCNYMHFSVGSVTFFGLDFCSEHAQDQTGLSSNSLKKILKELFSVGTNTIIM